MKERYLQPCSETFRIHPESGLLVASNEDLPIVPVTPFFSPDSDDDAWDE